MPSDAVRPEVGETEKSKPMVEGELTDAPLEDDVVHDDVDGDGNGER